MSTLNEAIHMKLHRKNCPYIKDCEHLVTKQFFIQVCSTPQYPACINYARRMDEAKRPIEWLTHLATYQSQHILDE